MQGSGASRCGSRFSPGKKEHVLCDLECNVRIGKFGVFIGACPEIPGYGFMIYKITFKDFVHAFEVQGDRLADQLVGNGMSIVQQ